MSKKICAAYVLVPALLLALSATPALAVEPNAAKPKDADAKVAITVERPVYAPEQALTFAEDNWKGFEGNCMPFAARCLKEGGMDTTYVSGSFKQFFKLLDKHIGGELHQLETIPGVKLKKNHRGKDGAFEVRRTDDNKKTAMAGDLVFWHCRYCKNYTHVGIIGEDQDDSLSMYARNMSEGNLYPMQAYCYEHGAGEFVTVFSYHIPREGEAAEE